MEEALVSALLTTILGNITSFPAEMRIAGDLNNELHKLESSLTTIQAVLQDAEQKQRKSQVIKNWLRKLKAVAYDIENVLDVCATEALDRRLHPNFRNQVSRFFSLSNPLYHRMKTAHRLKKLREKLDFIAAEKHQFHLVELAEASEQESRQTSSLVIESEILGRDDEGDGLIDKLINQVRDNDDTSVISICGMGGLGKTTLAQLVYNDERVVGAFYMRIWVCVSDDFDIRRLTKAILESIEGNRCIIEELDPLQRRLQEKLIGKRFLLVLDDVWNEYEDKWDKLKEVFRYGARGSAVIVTTRVEKIALMMATEPVHHLGRLSEDDSWSLFKRRAFGRTYPGDCAHLEVIGKEVLKKCGGVPLAIKALGGLLRFKRKESEWLSVKESELWDLEDEGNKVLSALRLSYDNLNPHLRQCFAFCAVFPKDYVMRKDHLIQLWMANGFIPSRPYMELHDVGCEIFNELTLRSFFIDVKEDLDHYIIDISCKMHDVIHDLALSIARDECFMIESNEKIEAPKHVHHLSIYQSYSGSAIPLKLYLNKISSIRSLLILRNTNVTLFPGCFKNKFLRILKLPNLNVVHGYKQLRYLDLSSSSIKVLPNSVSCIHNLQTLNLKDCGQLEMLPKDLRHLKELVYLDIRGCHSLACLPVSIGKLVHLRKLGIFIVGNENGYGIDELQELDLGGDLHVKQLENVKNITEARSADLIRKQNLLSLTLDWGIKNSANNVHANIVEDVLSGLQPHPNLKKLVIRGFEGVRLPFWIMKSLLPNLVVISLNCERCEKLPPLGKLVFLKTLRIYSNSLQFIGTELYGDSGDSFPSLEDVIIIGDSLKEWKTMEEKNNFPRLRRLTVCCPQLSEIPILPSLKDLQVSNCSMSLLNALQSFTFLTSLDIYDVDNLPNMWLRGFSLLESLDISRSLKSGSIQFDNLCVLRSLRFQWCDFEALPEGLGNLRSLRSLMLSYCDNLVSLPADAFCGLSSLSRLSIENCKKLSSLSDNWQQHLTTLQDLTISNCPELMSLPDSICHLTTLRTLSIWVCQGLTALPLEMGQLTSLSSLDIRDCPNLMCLPAGLQNLTMLSILRISDCPHLERRCERGTGADWPNIAHIPDIEIWRSRYPPRSNLLARVGDYASRVNRCCRA